MREVKQKEIRAIAMHGHAVDITHMKHAEVMNIYKNEHGFSTILFSHGVYGCNGKVLQGNETGNWYACTDRTCNVFWG